MLGEAENQGKVKILDRGDPSQRLQVMVKQIKEAVKQLRESGIDMDIMISYIHAKTRIPVSIVSKVLTAQADFFNRFGGANIRLEEEHES